MASEASGVSSGTTTDCPVCLQVFLHPTRLPCSHTFCFLCLKGSINQNRGCPLCRREIPNDYLNNPNIVDNKQIPDDDCDDELHWYYEGRNKSGWWAYDERSNKEINAATRSGLEKFELLIAGTVYIIDVPNSLQYQKNNPHRKRKIKYDRIPIPTKGVAGIKRLNGESEDVREDSNIVDLTDDSMSDGQTHGISVDSDEC